uniref:NADH-ubiquinone oxidoreductase chain 6 n=1 Tax=Scarodytes savinensis TaxID=483878 RepID=A0A894JWC2_9DYTI|nr:NADH dehydrogenase subunit 6 [Scarodytes savinensis]QRV62891.1 NADH dehydrogenase subunit 6 [Scarodytes savinensis]
MFLTYYLMNLSMTMMFLFLNHPMSMGMILMIQTILITLISGLYSFTYWFSYILFLIMIGGMMVLFMYMTSLASNEKFNFSKKILLLIITMLIISTIMNFNDMSIINLNFKNSNMMEMINNMIMLKNENIKSLNFMYNKPNFIITIMLINYLLLTLVAVVKITKSKSGPLRQKF